MAVQTSVKLPDELRARLDRAAELMARDRSSLIIEALDQYLAGVVSPEEVARQCHAANEADASDDWESFVEWPRGCRAEAGASAWTARGSTLPVPRMLVDGVAPDRARQAR